MLVEKELYFTTHRKKLTKETGVVFQIVLNYTQNVGLHGCIYLHARSHIYIDSKMNKVIPATDVVCKRQYQTIRSIKQIKDNNSLARADNPVADYNMTKINIRYKTRTNVVFFGALTTKDVT